MRRLLLKKGQNPSWFFVNGAAIFFLSAVSLYIVVRAAFLSITHDEAITIMFQGTQPYSDIFLYKAGSPPNNHVINSLLVRLAISIFGYNEIFIRIAGLIGGFLYIIFAYKLSKKLFSRTLLFALSLSLLILNPYVLDFFSLARGYSLALGLLITSLFFMFSGYEDKEPNEALRDKIKAFIFMSLSVISNLSFLNVYLSLFCTYMVIEVVVAYPVFKQTWSFNLLKDTFKKELFYILIITLSLAVLIYRPLAKISRAKQFYGGNSGFWHDTVTSLINASLYNKGYFNLVNIVIITILALFLIYFIIRLIHKKSIDSCDRELIIISSIITFASLSVIFQNILFGTPFVVIRTAIYFIPLFTLFVFILWKSILDNLFFKFKIVPHVFLIFCGMLFLFHYISCLNLSHTYDWQYDASTKAAMNQIFKKGRDLKSEKDQITIGATWFLVPAIDYYIIKHGGPYKYIEPNGVDTAGPDGLFDYYYLQNSDKDILIKRNATVLDYYSVSKTFLGAANTINLKPSYN